MASLVAIHRHPLRASAHLTVSSRADGSATMALCAALLEGQQLLGTEGLVVDLRRRLDQVLQVRAEEEVSEVDELAVVLVLNVDHAPPILTTTNLLTVDDDRLFGTDNSEWDQVLRKVLAITRNKWKLYQPHEP